MGRCPVAELAQSRPEEAHQLRNAGAIFARQKFVSTVIESIALDCSAGVALDLSGSLSYTSAKGQPLMFQDLIIRFMVGMVFLSEGAQMFAFPMELGGGRFA